MRAIEIELLDILSSARLEWLSEQVAEIAGEGHFEVRVGKRGQPTERLSVESASDTRRGEIGTRPFTVYERVDLLVQTAIVAITQTVELEDVLRDELIEPLGVEQIEFIDVDTDGVARVISQPPSAPGSDRDRTNQVVRLLEQVRATIDEQTL